MKTSAVLGRTVLRSLAGAGMACATGAFWAADVRAQSSTFYPLRASAAERAQLTNQAAGFVRSSVGGEDSRGSGAVARHPQLVFTAAHVIFEDGTWATPGNIEFHRLLNQGTDPPPGGVSPRGFVRFSTYRGQPGGEGFDLDFAVLYGNIPFGPAAPYFTDRGVEWVRSVRPKKIVGYPAVIDATGEEGKWFQHNTREFTISAEIWEEEGMKRYYFFNDVSTGRGNSGGPVFVKNGSGVWGLAAVVVSSLGAQAGVHALDAATHSISNTALGRVADSPGITKKFKTKRKLRLPPGKAKFQKRKLRVDGFSGNVSTLRFRTKFRNRHQKKLEVYLEAPSGRFRWIARGNKGRRKKFKINKDYSARFRGGRANGVWRLFMRDAEKSERSKRAVFRMFSLTIGD